MIKWLLVIGVIAFVYYMFIKKKPIIQKTQTKKKQETPADELVKCASCDVYCELNDAILSNAKYYCSDECLKKATS